ncbi:N-substituted formamide deformylase [Geodia barretti]|uniref:N-substituted formamide deformylase n=1 Tax=Geodia barretti TaxID=519541 RepID=A0AA35X4I3_GEOBA|nr:N-substituted formamide deformylase [Geodia barretti]
MPNGIASLILVNADMLTMESAHPKAEAIAICGDRIAAVGSNESIRLLATGRTRLIDCQGLTLLPGFNDAHCHLPGLARRLQDLNCSPQHAPSIARLQDLVRARARTYATGAWIRGFGYYDLQLAERRHPNRHDLDIASPDHPCWLEHRSGHAAVLNSRALALADIDGETPDPPGGVIERDPATGEPTGVLYEMQGFLRGRLGSTRSPEEFDESMRAAGELLRGYGITSVQDAGHDNGVDRWGTLQRLRADAALSCRITMFAGVERLDELVSSGLVFGSGDHWLRLGHAKILLTLSSGSLHPSPTELEALVSESHRTGFPVAIHCIEEAAIAVAAATLSDNGHPDFFDRIEHCAEGAPGLVDAIGQCGATVVTQPGFLYHSGASYRVDVEERLLPHLYPAGALARSGVTIAFGSDAPVIDPNPWPGIYSAVTRCASDGRPLSGTGTGEQALDVWQALRAYTLGSAEAEGTSTVKGSLAAGKLADFVLVDTDPLSIDYEALPNVKPLMTVVGGTVVWDNR